MINLSADKDARAARGVPRAEARRPVRRVRRRRARRRASRCAPQHGAVGRLRGRRARGAGIRAKLAAAGFEEVEVEPWRIYRAEDARAFLAQSGLDVDELAPQVDGRFVSAFIRARKPQIAG